MSYLFGLGLDRNFESNMQARIAQNVEDVKRFEELHPEAIKYYGYYFHPIELGVLCFFVVLFAILSVIGFNKSKQSVIKRVGISIFILSIVVLVGYLFIPYLYEKQYTINFDIELIKAFTRESIPFDVGYSSFEWQLENTFGWCALGVVVGCWLSCFHEWSTGFFWRLMVKFSGWIITGKF